CNNIHSKLRLIYNGLQLDYGHIGYFETTLVDTNNSTAHNIPYALSDGNIICGWPDN
ncbi:1842_t:CDS:2, partial [Funneliformis geosporum]